MYIHSISLSLYIYIYICTDVCTCIHIYIYIYIIVARGADRQVPAGPGVAQILIKCMLKLVSGKDQGGPSKGGFLNHMLFS